MVTEGRIEETIQALPGVVVSIRRTAEEARFMCTAIKNAANEVGAFFRGLSSGNTINVRLREED